MQLKEALWAAGTAELYYDGYTAYVEEQEEDETYGLSISSGGMPPFYIKNDLTWAALKKEVNELHAPQPHNWVPVQPD